jgi:hypothetical protein
MITDIIYQDNLVEISNDSILLKNYYFPSQKPKEILFDSIKNVEVKLPTLATGKWRFQGTGDFHTWFPLDTERNKRDKIFFISLKNKWIQIGFTVEDSETVQNIFKSKGLLSPNAGKS